MRHPMNVNTLTLADRIIAGVVAAGALALLPRPAGFPASESFDILEYDLWSTGPITVSHEAVGGVVYPANEHVIIKVRHVTSKDGPIAPFFVSGAAAVNVLVHARQSSYADI